MNKIYYEKFIIFLEELSRNYQISDKKMLYFKNYYGVEINVSLSLQEIGDESNISKERVRQSIEDVKQFCRIYIDNDGLWFKSYLIKLNNIIYKKLPSEKERLIYHLFEETHCSKWVLFQDEIFGIKSKLSFSKNNGYIFVFNEGYESIKLSSFKEKQALKLGYEIKDKKIFHLSEVKKTELDFLYEERFIKKIDLVSIILSKMRKDIIKNGSLHTDNFIKNRWSDIEKFSTVKKITYKNKNNFIFDIINTEKDFIVINNKWIFSKTLGRNVMIRNIYKILSIYRKMDLNKMRKILLLKTNIEFLPPINVLKNIISQKEDLFIVNNNIKIKDLNKDIYVTQNEQEIFNRIKENGMKSIYISSYDPLWSVANQSVLFKKNNNGKISLF